MTRLPGAIVMCALIFGGTLPAEAQRREQQQTMADIRILQEQTQQLQLALASLAETLAALNARLDDQAGVTRKAFADQKLLSDTVSADIRVVRERVDETNVRITSLSQEVEAMRLTIPAMSYAPGGGAPAPPAADPAGTETAMGAVPPPAQAAPPGMSPQRLFDTAWADYTSGQWTLAIEGFNTYIRTFPRSELSDDAQHYIGESYYSEGRFTDAIEAYNRVIADYPTGDQVPNAYYKRGLAFDRLGQVDQARQSFEVVVRDYPDTTAGTLAQQNLDRLTQRRPPG
ncbi:MAG: tol-pal system protein YbgF [Vicinamibacterales bacterium]|nr:tol-pal system protein YbgF [Vicinamibacterales bacterium]